MIPSSANEQKREAFLLFEDGRYQESLDLCYLLLATEKEQSLEVLTATNLFYTGKLEDAEVFFRDLCQRMPESSYIHSYLAKVLEARGDEGAIAEWRTAVHLDPTNQDALRSYADYLMARKDFRGALPVLKRLVQQGKKPGDTTNLVRALVGIGEPQEAIATCTVLGLDPLGCPEYLDALCQSKDYRRAAETAEKVWRECRDPAILRIYLYALSQYDVPAALAAYAALPERDHDPAILFNYIQLLMAQEDYAHAHAATQALLAIADMPRHRLIECELCAALGNDVHALAAYEHLIAAELRTKNDLDQLEQIIGKYRDYIIAHLSRDEALSRFLSVVSDDVNVVSLRETARFYEVLGDVGEARAWYYRAYRADYLAGGLPYATFLAGLGEERECEKVMLYILSNVKKSADLGRVAAVITEKGGRMFGMKRLVVHLIKRLLEQQHTLSSEELVLLASAFHIAATIALDEADYALSKYYCFAGMDVIPAHTRTIRLEDFMQHLIVAKERSIADPPVMHFSPMESMSAPADKPAQQLIDQLALTAQEQQIVEFLRLHRKASEMDLRKLTGTRRVVGIVNRLISKATAQGIMLISKRGVSEDGEVYEYAGT
ncbi:MAG: hypothetical protein NTZ39_09785 [Methanoregula sp.]|nr:hypothetical protein [Methanoregula sp.]